ncbi:PGC-1 and ERR-induced regulator in muscle protein 1 [Xiphias gladius]|uniref:PGC-1 and ERR-induced regulator in muscle protein 1 n=1 Tax=Xiphias gladius TaxID=8245 RepID=UPI001A999F63|nr:PGC-1 and ERR-induced regulator in muscle protein 1 [Xiphias gladius]XP_040007855.1 PGC-1 and ERR-induced regulator in muscle protein 1 [Xiphias gladius]
MSAQSTPPDCEGSPVEHYLSKPGVGGMESILSGSEEDIDLQSVNIFFERLKNLTEAERFAQPSHLGAGNNREAILEEEQCSDGQQSNSSTLPKNIPKSNSLPARGETAVGKETIRPVDTISNTNAIKKVKPGSNISSEPAASNLVLQTNKSAKPKTELFIREEACTETRVNEVTKWNQSNDLADRVACSETKPHTDEGMKVDMCTPKKDVEQEYFLTSQLTLSDKCNTNSPSNLEMVTNVKWKDEQNPAVLQSDATGINKSASQELSPSASVKRKRRKKRRQSFEPAESARGYERQVLAKPRDSEEEQYAGRGGTGLCLSEDVNLFYLNEPQKNVASSLHSVTSNQPVTKSAKEIKANDLSHTVPRCESQYQYLPESIVRQERCKATISTEKNATNDRSVTSLSQTDDSVMSAASNSGNVVRHLQPCTKLQVEELTRLNKYSGFQVLVTAGATGKSDMARETANSERKDNHAESLQQSDKVNLSITGYENEQSLKCCTAEVKSIYHSILPSTESNDSTVEVSQNDKLSAAKSILAVEAGNSGGDNHTLCQREAEPQQQLDIDCHDTDRYSSTLEKTHALNTKPQHFETTACPFLKEISSKVTCAKLKSDSISSSPDKSYLSKSPSILNERPLEVGTLSKVDILSEKNGTAERAQLAASQIIASTNPCTSGEINQINQTDSSQSKTKLSVSEDSITNPSDITPVSSCCTLESVSDITESVTSLSNENITDLSGSFCSSVSQNEYGSRGEKNPLISAKHEEGDAKSGSISQSLSNGSTQSKCDLPGGAEDAVRASEAECEPKKAPESKHSVFAMSSFWSEMEKLTINDILGLRMINKADPPISLPPLHETEETRMFSTTDSGFFTQLDEPRPEQTNEYTSRVPDCVESILDSVMTVDSSSPRSIMWESEPVPVSLGNDIYPENIMLTSGRDISPAVLSESAQKNLRQISKNVSVHNLHALESFSSRWKGQTLQTLDEGGESEKVENFSEKRKPKQDKDTDSLPSPLTTSYRTSVTDIFQYLFGGKQSIPSQSATDNITTIYTDGNSVPETYDHFFSEFGTEDLLSPLITAEDPAKDELVPIFSYSRSANRNLQFPEAYDYFFSSSASDDSSVESDEEDNCGPVRVVTRLSRKASASQISADIYENFFTDNDLRQNFFWKTILSFRSINFTGSTVQKQTLSNSLSHVPVRQSGRCLRKTVYPSNALGNQDVMFPDPLLYHLEDRISRQQAQQPFRYEDLQMAVSNPRLDASLLPLRQSDMCLVCIAFASWVLRTANPEVGDAWKAVLLANVSALSAIRYLRKYVKMEAGASEKKLHHTAQSET